LSLKISVEQLFEGSMDFCVDFFLGVAGCGEQVAVLARGERPRTAARLGNYEPGVRDQEADDGEKCSR